MKSLLGFRTQALEKYFISPFIAYYISTQILWFSWIGEWAVWRYANCTQPLCSGMYVGYCKYSTFLKIMAHWFLATLVPLRVVYGGCEGRSTIYMCVFVCLLEAAVSALMIWYSPIMASAYHPMLSFWSYTTYMWVLRHPFSSCYYQ